MPKKEEKKEAPKEQGPQKRPVMRQIVIETDGSNINLIKNETVGVLELAAVLQTLLAKIRQQ